MKPEVLRKGLAMISYCMHLAKELSTLTFTCDFSFHFFFHFIIVIQGKHSTQSNVDLQTGQLQTICFKFENT